MLTVLAAPPAGWRDQASRRARTPQAQLARASTLHGLARRRGGNQLLQGRWPTTRLPWRWLELALELVRGLAQTATTPPYLHP